MANNYLLTDLREIAFQKAREVGEEFFLPVERVSSLAGGNEDRKLIRGKQGEAFGITRFIVTAYKVDNAGNRLARADNHVLISAHLNEGHENVTMFRDVHASTLQRLFEYRHFRIPFVIEDANALTIVVKSLLPSTEKVEVHIALDGYGHRTMRALRSEYIIAGRGKQGAPVVPRPVMLFGYKNLNATERKSAMDVGLRSIDCQFRSFFISGSDEGAISVAIQRHNDQVFRHASADMVNKLFQTKDSLQEIRLERRVPMTVFADNHSTNPISVSFVAEAYELPFLSPNSVERGDTNFSRNM